MEVLKDVAAIIGLVLSVITLLTLCTKGGRSAIKSIFKRETKDIVEENKQQTEDIASIKNDVETLLSKLDVISEFSRQQCRNNLKHIYYKYCRTKKIPLFERKTADKVYELYVKKLKGNSYANLLYHEIEKWEIDNITYKDQDIEEED